MAKKRLNRRTVLKGLALGSAVAIPLPRLVAMLNDEGTAYAAGVPVSRAYVTWFFGNGILPGLWNPTTTGSGAAWSLSEQLAPLAGVKSHLTVISGLASKLPSASPHPAGSAAATTGGPVINASAQRPSVDQIIADVVGTDTAFRSLEVGVTPATPNGPENTLHAVSHGGPNAPNPPEFDPMALFTRLFMTGTMADLEAAEQLARVRTSVLDAVLEDGAALGVTLGSTDRARLEQHLEAIRSLERRLQTTSTCVAPMAPTVGEDTGSEGPPEVNTAMVELSSLALSCELTRVMSFVFTLPAAHVFYRHLGPELDDDFHDTICHLDPGDASNQPRVNTGVLYAMRSLNEFVERLASLPHGAGSLLDDALVYATSCTAWGKIHTTDEWPALLIGKAGGSLRGDEHHRFPGENLSRVLLTAARIMGSEVTELGMNEGLVNAELPGVV